MERVMVVTGANRGIGRAAAIELARRGARVVMVCRDAARGTAALADVRRAAGSSAVELQLMDLASQRSIREGAARLCASHPRLQVLVNNAGVFPRARQQSEDGIELTLAVNVLAPFLLTQLLLPSLTAGAPARVVNVGSYLHARGCMHWDDPQLARHFDARAAYAQSKLALLLLTRALARRTAATGVVAHCADPGRVGTRPTWWPWRRLRRPWFLAPEDGARTPVALASDDKWGGVSGRYVSRAREIAPAPAAEDDTAAERLWRLCEQLTAAP